MATTGKIKIIERPNVPPSFLGECSIIVTVGQTVNITKAMLMNTMPPYQHEVTSPTPEIGSLQISGFIGADYRNFLAPSNHATLTFGILTGASRISQNTNGVIVNPNVTRAVLTANNFKVQGVKPGQGVVKYRATAFDTSNNNESTFSTTEGRINITVISANNLPPTHVDDGLTTCELGQTRVLDYVFFLTNYQDPENNPPKDVRVLTLPPVNKGSLVYNGITVTASMLPLDIPAEQLDLGVLVYSAIGQLSINETINFQYTVSDTGSGQFM